MSDITDEDIRRILSIIDGLGDSSISIEFNGLKLQVTNGDVPAPVATPAAAPPRASAAAPAPAAGIAEPVAAPAAAPPKQTPALPIEIPAGQIAVRAPTAGTFYRAPSPGSPPFVEVGDRVKPDDTVCVFDVMKLFTSMRAGVAGTVSAILVPNQTVVAQGQPLILIAPDA